MVAPVVYPQAFEVATVKPSAPVPPTGGVYFGPQRGGPGTSDPELITWTYPTLRTLFLSAYELNTFQLKGPDWIDTQRYDIVAKVPAGATKDQVKVMWQKLLNERFGVVLHHETKEFQVEELVVDKSRSKLKETDWDSASPLPEGPPQMDGKGGVKTPGQVLTIFPLDSGVRMHIVGRAQPVAQLMGTFTNTLRRPVLDKTGLLGRYDYTLDFVVEGAGPAAARGNADEPAPDLTTAVQQQLGLRLVPGKAMLDVLVIDKAEKVPIAN
jgi:uncharacterized protein (TIGR03435 family)